MNEQFLHYIWHYKLFKINNLYLTSGEPIEVIHIGEKNINAGPDFTNAKIKISNTIWAGNIEIHINASDWYKHHHEIDKSYNNVILHVVINNDKVVYRQNGETIPTIKLEYYDFVYNNYKYLITNKTRIKCANNLSAINDFDLTHFTDQLLIRRLYRKSESIYQSLEKNNNNWEETFYQLLAQSFGFKVNSLPINLVSKYLNLSILSKHRNNLLQIESMLFGVSGLLIEKGEDKYYNQLQKEFSFLQKKYHLKVIEPNLWKFMRLRPKNFPTVRLAQFASIIYHTDGLFSKMIESNLNSDYKKLFKTSTSNYWDSHYNFNKASKNIKKKLGDSSINTIVLNAVLPMKFVYSKFKGATQLTENVLNTFETIPAENNRIIKKWHDLGFKTENAYKTQAFLELYNEFCLKNNCLQCQFGHKLMTKKIS